MARVYVRSVVGVVLVALVGSMLYASAPIGVPPNASGVSAEAAVVEVHGTVHRYECVDCGARGPMADALDRVREGDADPACELCGGILKSATVMFGQSLDPVALQRAVRAAVEADVLVAVGTSLTVYPVAGIVPEAVEAGRSVIIVNAEETPFDPVAVAVVRGSASEMLPRLVRAGR